jgi:hypothetical protein
MSRLEPRQETHWNYVECVENNRGDASLKMHEAL